MICRSLECFSCLALLVTVATAERKKIVVQEELPTPPPQPHHEEVGNRAHRYGVHAAMQQPQSARGCPGNSVLRVDFTPAAGGDGRIYANMFGSGVLLANAQDVFEYEIMWKDAQCNCGSEFEVGSQYRLRDNGPLDERGYSPHSERNANMTNVAFGKWYHRRWSMAAVEGKYVDKFVLSSFSTPGLTSTAFFRFIRIVKGSEVRRVVFDRGSEPPTVSAYFPGTIVTSCQHPLLLDDANVFVISGTGLSERADSPLLVRPGDVVRTRGFVTAKSLEDLALPPPRSCLYFADWKEEMKWRAATTDHRVQVLAVRGRVRHATLPLTLFDFVQWNGTQPAFRKTFLPFDLHGEFRVPLPSLLTHLVNGSKLELVVEYQLHLDGWDSSPISSVVRTHTLLTEL